ncbi:hypothetical protein SAMD00019534_057540 [Acytostelium subglobosum LB1]|uniref:hypothetical protein n=1 Tax=Acytostelium subglobosum LB1 TaxID=1410327 RepID=UPI0006451DC6|nr:hypothetical protein SAMD00019534_057540 [Acytostelium subglobosum LB1]GAM22579.1 hypothetical protein SAMD00019534_057540 [Acytostelium subglobosum LB1]|eukprot:XP_012754699.1 hypothetical protein SAMD00019534_057540 [Acytostelium subglobosum LB1]
MGGVCHQLVQFGMLEHLKAALPFTDPSTINRLLDLALYFGRQEIMDYLVQTTTIRFSVRAIDVATHHGNLRLIDYVIGNCTLPREQARVACFRLACAHGLIDVAKHLLESQSIRQLVPNYFDLLKVVIERCNNISTLQFLFQLWPPTPVLVLDCRRHLQRSSVQRLGHATDDYLQSFVK